MIHLRGHNSDAVIDLSHGAPVIVHWGAPLCEPDGAALAASLERPRVHAAPDAVAPISVVPEHGSGFPGRPGLLGARNDGRDWAPRFRPAGHHLESGESTGVLTGASTGALSGVLTVEALDDVAGLSLTTTIGLGHVLSVRIEVTNLSPDEPYQLSALSVTLPLVARARELLTLGGRWGREFQMRRNRWHEGAVTVENRRGRTSHEYPPLIFVGATGFAESVGEVWGAHLAWSGNHAMLAERLPDGRRYLQLGELLHPGEITLEPAESYRSPEVTAVYSENGLSAATRQFHRRLRARPEHPRTPRPVMFNTWEATYFDHKLDRLLELADRAAQIGAERYVLDDGWFGSRRDDTSGLGDWIVSPEAHPQGLEPLITHVTGLGMSFGLWVEPGMVNPDSDLYREHPEWALANDGYEPVLARNQLVLDLARPEAFDHVLDRLDRLLTDHDITFLKWDMNRDHIGAGGATSKAGTHAQTAAVYRLMDTLRCRHPSVEIESCSSGGARVDHEILRRTQRVWASDCTDPLERQMIQRGASLLIPPEIMGAHIGPERSHTTGRRHDLAFRAATALFGHFGIECDLLELSNSELDDLAEVVATHKRFRPLLHSGDTVRFDTEDTYSAHGVYASDLSEALVSFAVVAPTPSLTPPRLLMPGLDPVRRYRVERVPLPGERAGPTFTAPPWWDEGVQLHGDELGYVGLQLPGLHPDTAVLIHLLAA